MEGVRRAAEGRRVLLGIGDKTSNQFHFTIFHHLFNHLLHNIYDPALHFANKFECFELFFVE